ncbi:MAG: DUF6174 domain-containing protein [Vicinamibacteria bacterium]
MKTMTSTRSGCSHVGRIALAVLCLVAAACGSLTEPSGPHAEEQKRLTVAQSLWRSQGLNDYSYVFTRGCFCAPEFREPVTITVRSGAVVSVASVSSGVSRDIAGYQTIDGLFGVVQKAINDDAASIRAEYDPVRGYLASAYIDLDTRLADEEISIEAKAVTPVR